MARRYRIVIAAAAVLLSLPILLCAALLLLGNTDRGRRLIEHYTEQLSGGQVLLHGGGERPAFLAASTADTPGA